MEDSLAVAGTNAAIEGADYVFVKRTPRNRVGNYTQIFETPIEVSDTQRSVDVAGLSDEFAYEMAKAVKEQARDKQKMSRNLAKSVKLLTFSRGQYRGKTLC
jgi:hypothetical protein